MSLIMIDFHKILKKKYWWIRPLLDSLGMIALCLLLTWFLYVLGFFK